MRRQAGLEDISDGRLYSRRDMAKVGCAGCRGCSRCCRETGNTVILDPLDLHRLVCGTGLSFEELMAAKRVELNVADGIVLPNLCISGRGGACGFLNEEGRCGIHSFRPGFCRLFPLGRYYLREEGPDGEPGDLTFRYILQIHECPAPNKTKVRIEKWLDEPDLARWEEFVLKWHGFLLRAEQLAAKAEEEQEKKISLFILKYFYLSPYDPQADFYEQFAVRLARAEDVLGLL